MGREGGHSEFSSCRRCGRIQQRPALWWASGTDAASAPGAATSDACFPRAPSGNSVRSACQFLHFSAWNSASASRDHASAASAKCSSHSPSLFDPSICPSSAALAPCGGCGSAADGTRCACRSRLGSYASCCSAPRSGSLNASRVSGGGGLKFRNYARDGRGHGADPVASSLGCK